MFEYRAIVFDVHDGDTITVSIDLGFDTWIHNRHLRLKGINAPELKDKPAGQEARDFLRSLILPGTAILVRTYKDEVDKYGGRYDAVIYTADFSTMPPTTNQNLNELMISSGHAVRYVVP